MIRNVGLEEISDGRLYGPNDMVKADCHDCEGCSACCRGMGSSIVLDPLDIHRMVGELNVKIEQLLANQIELQVADGIVLPNLRMSGESEACAFLDEQGRCSIHSCRPGICRLFPLGRYYEEDQSFRYFLQVHECRKKDRTKVKVHKWIDTPDIARYERFIAKWHGFLKEIQKRLEREQSEETAKQASLYLLTNFYLTPFDQNRDFYDQFEQRLKTGEKWLSESLEARAFDDENALDSQNELEE